MGLTKRNIRLFEFSVYSIVGVGVAVEIYSHSFPAFLNFWFILLIAFLLVIKHPDFIIDKIFASTTKLEKEQDEYNAYLDSKGFDTNNKNDKTDEYHLNLCSQFLEEHPDNEHAHLMKAFLLFKLGKYSETLEVYNYLFEKNPNCFYIDSSRYAACYYALGQTDTAFNILEKHNPKSKNDGEYYRAAALMFCHLADHEKEVEYFTKAIELAPDNGHNYMYRAHGYKALNQMDKYEADMEKCKEFNPEFFNMIMNEDSEDDNTDKTSKNKDELSLNNSKSLKP